MSQAWILGASQRMLRSDSIGSKLLAYFIASGNCVVDSDDEGDAEMCTSESHGLIM